MRWPSVDTRREFHGLTAVILENRCLRAVSSAGSRCEIQQITDKLLDTDLLWNHPRVVPAKLPFGANYDDNWCGGWDELFPNDIPETVNGETYPDHGEVRAAAWDFSLLEEAERAGVKFSCKTRICDVRLEKRIWLRAEDSTLRLECFLGNCSQSALPFDPAFFRACWLFGPFGGWRNLNAALLEPSRGILSNWRRAANDCTLRGVAARLKSLTDQRAAGML